MEDPSSHTIPDQEYFEKEFVKFQSELRSFIYRLVTHQEETEDLAQETFIRAFKNLASFNHRGPFKAWVFTIAANLAKDSLRARQKWGEDWMEVVRDAHVEDPKLLRKKFEVSRSSEHGKFVIREHINYCFNCVSKSLLLTNQICLLLKEVYHFKVSEIVQITGLTEGKVKHALADARADMTRIFKKRCALINKEGICHQCTGLNNRFNPEQETQKELLKIPLIKEQRQKNYQQLLDLRLQLVQTINPLEAEGFDLHNYLIENSPNWAKQQLTKKGR